jgi:hypothetical protein
MRGPTGCRRRTGKATALTGKGHTPVAGCSGKSLDKGSW